MRGRGTFDPSLNPNAYPMTDERLYPSAVTVRINGIVAGRETLADDPADHRGILSWHYQKHDRRGGGGGAPRTLLAAGPPPHPPSAPGAPWATGGPLWGTRRPAP